MGLVFQNAWKNVNYDNSLFISVRVPIILPLCCTTDVTVLISIPLMGLGYIACIDVGVGASQASQQQKKGVSITISYKLLQYRTVEGLGGLKKIVLGVQ